MRIQFLFLGLALLAATPVAYAQQPPKTVAQLHFDLTPQGHMLTYNYKWIDDKRELREMSFELEQDLVKQSTQEFKPIDPQDIQNFVAGAVTAYAATLKPKGVELTVTKGPNGQLSMAARSRVPQWQLDQEMEKVKLLVKEAKKAYYHKHFYLKNEDDKIWPDYARIADDYRDKLKPVSDAFVGKTMRYEFRDRVNLILSFFQSIPYDTLQDRNTSNGSGFATPIELLTQNRGDCDTKTAAFASILRTMYYRIPMIMVFIPGHAFVGLATPPQPGDETLKVKGRTYVLSEPVGPAIMPLGTLGPNSAKKLRENDYRAVSFEHWSLQ